MMWDVFLSWLQPAVWLVFGVVLVFRYRRRRRPTPPVPPPVMPAGLDYGPAPEPTVEELIRRERRRRRAEDRRAARDWEARFNGDTPAPERVRVVDGMTGDAYTLRVAGATWPEIADAYGYRTPTEAREDAMKYLLGEN